MSKKKSSIKKPDKVVLGVVTLFVVLIIIALAISVSDKEGDLVADEQYLAELQEKGLVLYNDPHSGIRLTYPDDLSIKISEDPSQTQNVTFTLLKDDPKVQITSWTEKGDSVSQLAVQGKSMNELVLNNVKSQLDSIYQEVNIDKEELIEINGFKAGELIFTYKSNDGSIAKQRMIVFIKNTEETVTVAAQSREENFDRVNKDYFDKIFDSISF